VKALARPGVARVPGGGATPGHRPQDQKRWGVALDLAADLLPALLLIAASAPAQHLIVTVAV
jgi:hypothetical protein